MVGGFRLQGVIIHFKSKLADEVHEGGLHAVYEAHMVGGFRV